MEPAKRVAPLEGLSALTELVEVARETFLAHDVESTKREGLRTYREPEVARIKASAKELRNYLNLEFAARRSIYEGLFARLDRALDEGNNEALSSLLATALKNGELIIAVTVQTFPFALDEIRADSALKGKQFAVIADEAHSSQSGQISSKLKQVLTAEEIKEIAEGGDVDVESILASEMTERAESENISHLAFTATPKHKTLELFGRKGLEGKPCEFHLYSMKQAIEEGYILDVLKGYQAYDTALKIAGKAGSSGEGGEIEEAAARKGLMRWVRLHPTNISQKVQIIVEHFHTNVAHLLEGKAKAMVVTDSRKAAVKYKKAIDAYIAKRATEDASYNYRTLVAFSGSVSMAEDEEWAPTGGRRPRRMTNSPRAR